MGSNYGITYSLKCEGFASLAAEREFRGPRMSPNVPNAENTATVEGVPTE